jgi:hypothetical protein
MKRRKGLECYNTDEPWKYAELKGASHKRTDYMPFM